MNYPSIAAQIVAAVGGRENLSHVMHCATRLRLTCLDESKINADAIADIEGVKGVFSAKGQFQIIFGSGTVNQVCDEVLKLTGNGSRSMANRTRNLISSLVWIKP